MKTSVDWIDVHDALPIHEIEYLIAVTAKGNEDLRTVFQCFFDEGRNQFYFGASFNDENEIDDWLDESGWIVTHWAMMPDPPE